MSSLTACASAISHDACACDSITAGWHGACTCDPITAGWHDAYICPHSLHVLHLSVMMHVLVTPSLLAGMDGACTCDPITAGWHDAYICPDHRSDWCTYTFPLSDSSLTAGIHAWA